MSNTEFEIEMYQNVDGERKLCKTSRCENFLFLGSSDVENDECNVDCTLVSKGMFELQALLDGTYRGVFQSCMNADMSPEETLDFITDTLKKSLTDYFDVTGNEVMPS